MNILFLILLLIAPVFAGDTTGNLIQEPDDMQTRVKKHLKTNKLTVFGDGDATELTSTYGFFHDRGDPGAFDFAIGDLTEDDAWHDLDLSGIVPAESKTVLLRVQMQSAVINRVIAFRENGNSNIYNYLRVTAQVADQTIEMDVIVSMDENRVIEYIMNDLTVANITVAGWWK